MARGTKIKDFPLTTPTDSLKIPIGNFGDFAVSVGSLREYFKIPHGIFVTNSASVFIQDGLFQEIKLQADGVLKSNVGLGQYTLLVIPSSQYDLDYSAFDVCNQFDYDRSVQNYILIVNLDGRKLLFGCKDVAPPVPN